MIFSIDRRALRDSIAEIKVNIDAVGETLDPGGRAEVVVSRRKKLPRERGQKVLHGMAIANILRDLGHDPFDLPPQVDERVSQFLAEEIDDAIARAFTTGRPQRGDVKRALIAAAMELVEAARDRINSGQLGTNAEKYKKKKIAFAARGIIRRVGAGLAPGYGRLTGRFVDGITWVWHSGYRGRG